MEKIRQNRMHGAVHACLKKFVTFSGRSDRSECGWWFLFLFLVHLVALVLAYLLSDLPFLQQYLPLTSTFNLCFAVSVFVHLTLLLPTLAVITRRLHDTQRNGWWIWAIYSFLTLFLWTAQLHLDDESLIDISSYRTALVLFLSLFIVSILLLAFWLCQPGNVGFNQYGCDPKLKNNEY